MINGLKSFLRQTSRAQFSDWSQFPDSFALISCVNHRADFVFFFRRCQLFPVGTVSANDSL